MDQCHINQRAGTITLLDAKGGKTRTLDLHNMARRALSDYLSPEDVHERARDQESVYVFTSQRAAWLRQQGRPDHLSERGIEHLWMYIKQRMPNGSSLRTSHFMIYATTLPIAHGKPPGR
jgi:integrase